MQTPRRGKKSFDAVNYFIRMHELVKYGRLPQVDRPMPANRKLALQQVFFRVKGAFRVDAEDIKGAIYFMYAHNPLNLSDLLEYGNSANFSPVMAQYLKWKRDNVKLVAEIGVKHAITKTIPKCTDADDYLAELMDTLLEGDDQ